MILLKFSLIIVERDNQKIEINVVYHSLLKKALEPIKELLKINEKADIILYKTKEKTGLLNLYKTLAEEDVHFGDTFYGYIVGIIYNKYYMMY